MPQREAASNVDALDARRRRRSRHRSRCGNRGACRSASCRRRDRAAACTGRRVFAASNAATQAISEAWVSLPPKPPPMRRVSHTTAWSGMRSARATRCCTSVGCCVELRTSMSPSSPGIGHARSGLRGRSAPARRSRCRPRRRCGAAASAAPRRRAASSASAARSSARAIASSMVSTGASTSYSTIGASRPPRAPRRCSRPPPRTATGRHIPPARRRRSGRLETPGRHR